MGRKAKKEPPARPIGCIRLKVFREALGLTQREMGAQLGGLAQDRYKQYEGRTRPTRELLTSIEKQFNIPPTVFLSDETIPEVAFNKFIIAMKENRQSVSTFFTKPSQVVLHNGGRGDDNPVTAEGNVGQGSIDFILTTLAEMKAEIAGNKKAIAELQEGANSKKGPTKGRT